MHLLDHFSRSISELVADGSKYKIVEFRATLHPNDVNELVRVLPVAGQSLQLGAMTFEFLGMPWIITSSLKVLPGQPTVILRTESL